MIFHRALLRELAGTALAVFLVLIGIVITTQLVRFLALAAGGSIMLKVAKRPVTIYLTCWRLVRPTE